MAFGRDLPNSARRHLRAANELFDANAAGAQPGCRAVAGYLYGLSGELAVKAIMRDSGMTPKAPSARRDDPYYAHFPELKSRLRDNAQGRRSGDLRVIAESNDFQDWNTDMRYAPTSDIVDKWVDTWRASAQKLVEKMDEI